MEQLDEFMKFLVNHIDENPEELPMIKFYEFLEIRDFTK